MAPFFHIHTLLTRGQEQEMQERVLYEVVQGGSGWILRQGRRPLVEFPTESQAVRAAVAVCRDEGLARLVVRRANGGVEEIDPGLVSFDVEA